MGISNLQIILTLLRSEGDLEMNENDKAGKDVKNYFSNLFQKQEIEPCIHKNHSDAISFSIHAAVLEKIFKEDTL